MEFFRTMGALRCFQFFLLGGYNESTQIPQRSFYLFGSVKTDFHCSRFVYRVSARERMGGTGNNRGTERVRKRDFGSSVNENYWH